MEERTCHRPPHPRTCKNYRVNLSAAPAVRERVAERERGTVGTVAAATGSLSAADPDASKQTVSWDCIVARRQ